MQVRRSEKSSNPKDNGQSPWFIGRLLFAKVASGRSTKRGKKAIANTTLVLVTAGTPEQAFNKLEAIGQSSEGACPSSSSTPCASRFVGVLDLVPIYEPIEDGCELLDEGKTEVDASRLRRYLPSKAQLLSGIHRIERRRREFGCVPMWGDATSSEGTHAVNPFRKK